MKLTGPQRRGLYQYWREQGDSPEVANKKKNSIWRAYEDHAKKARVQHRNTPQAERHAPPAVNLTYGQTKQLKKELEKLGPRIPDDIFKSRLGKKGKAVLETKKQHQQKYLARVKGYTEKVKSSLKDKALEIEVDLRMRGLKGKKLKAEKDRQLKELFDTYFKNLDNAKDEKEIYKAIQKAYSEGLKPTIELEDGEEVIRL